jgi:hypothetical protein
MFSIDELTGMVVKMTASEVFSPKPRDIPEWGGEQ